MKRLLPYLLLFCSGFATAADFRPENYTYSIRSAGRGNDRCILVQIACPIENPSVAADIASEYAVHGIIFQGNEAAENQPAQQPLVRKRVLSEEQKEWFDAFFRENRYRDYVVSVARGSMKIAKVKKRYTAEVIVAVDKSKLRRDLEQAGIIETLGAVFENQSE